jgi:serine/threonine protein kinase
MAPEIVQKLEFCGPPTDVYASGVLLFTFFCGCFPFKGKDDKDLYNKIAKEDLVLPDHIPENVRNLIKIMLRKNAEERPTAAQLLNEPWVREGLQ